MQTSVTVTKEEISASLKYRANSYISALPSTSPPVSFSTAMMVLITVKQVVFSIRNPRDYHDN